MNPLTLAAAAASIRHSNKLAEQIAPLGTDTSNTSEMAASPPEGAERVGVDVQQVAAGVVSPSSAAAPGLRVVR